MHDDATPDRLGRLRGRRPSQRARTPSAKGSGGRAPRPPRRLRLRRTRPPRHKVVAPPIPVRRRPTWLARPRWPVWTLRNGLLVAAVLLPAVAQMGDRLLQAMLTTSPLLGADPTRIEQLRAAAGVGGGGITLALTLAAIGLVRVRGAHLAGAAAVLAVFTLLPRIVHTANAGLATAPLPGLGDMIAPPGWDRAPLLTLSFWLAVVVFGTAAIDLAQRSITAAASTRRPAARRPGTRRPGTRRPATRRRPGRS